MKRKIEFMWFVLLLCYLVYVWIFLIKTTHRFPLLTSDYDANFPIYLPYITALRQGVLSLENPFVGTGISLISDPLSVLLNPLFIVPIAVFGYIPGYQLSITLLIVMSFFSMWFVLRRLVHEQVLQILYSFLFATSGAFAARVAAGHLQQTLSYPALPFLVYPFFPPYTFKKQMLLCIVLSYFIYSGDFYTTWMSLVLYGGVQLARLATEQAKFLVLAQTAFVLATFLALACVRIIPFFIDVYPVMQRFFPINSFAGSLHFWWFLLPFSMPLGVVFYDRPSVQRFLGMHYNWYEYFAFISPFVFVPLWYIFQVWKRQEVRLLISVLFVGALYVALGQWYSPFHYLYVLIPQLQAFRVPQRMYMLMVPVVILFSALCLEQIKKVNTKIYKWSVGLVLLGVVWTATVSLQIMTNTFESERTIEKETAQWLRQTDSGKFFVASFVCCMQYYLVEQQIPIMNYYYGWKKNDLPSFLQLDSPEPNLSVLRTTRPRYIIAPVSYNLSDYTYTLVYTKDHISIWKTPNETLTPAFESQR